MKVQLDPVLYKALKKKNVRIRKDFKIAIQLFSKDPFNKELNNHELKREWEGYRSIDVNADWRAIYEEIGTEKNPIAYFSALGIHKELYN